jgi:uncharacterized protein (DUF1800 family)
MSRRQLCLAALLSLLAAVSLYAKKQKPSRAANDPKHALHALDRLTFGPRPGDVQAVMAMGVDKWIDLQLHPDKIDNTAMQSRLAAYRTLQMSTHEMVLAFPPNPVAKAAMDGKIPMPRDPYRHAIYVAAIDRVEEKKEQKQNAQETAATGNSQPGDLTQRQIERREAHSAVDELILLPPPRRMSRILSLPVGEQHDLLQGVPYPKRQGLLAGLTPEQAETVVALNHPQAVIDGEVQSAKLLRAVYSERQLEEVLTDFWFNHFNVYIGKGGDRYLVTGYERDVIRPHVLGKFKDLLIATAQSPAMLFYLDNWQSEGPNSDAALGRPARANAPMRPGPWARFPGGAYQQRTPQASPQSNQPKRRSGLNENYARELMELHTLGVNGGYTQHDVTEVARVFTGWTLDQPQQSGGFIFRPRLHEPGDKSVLGHRIKEGGEGEGLQVLKLLAGQPATARFISTELAQRFVSDNPPQALIDAMSKTFLKSDGDIREVLVTMFRSPEFWAPEAYRARVKTPFEFVASSLRATQAQIVDPQPLLLTLNKMGQQMYGCQPPPGYSTKSEVWVNSAALLDRMNFGLALATNKIPGTMFDLAQLVSSASGPSLLAANSSLKSAPTDSGTNGSAAAKPIRGGTPATGAVPPAATGLASTQGEAMDPYRVQLKLEEALLAGDVSKQTHDTIEERIVSPQVVAGGQDSNHLPNVNIIAGLLLGSPEFQRK